MEQQDILQGRLFPVFLKYTSASVLSMLGLSLYVLADTFFIANGVGADGISGLNLVLPVYTLLNGIGLMLGVGGATRYALYQGEGKLQEGNRVFTHVLTAALAVGVVFTLAGVFLAGPIAAALGADAEILPYAELYLRTLLCYSVAFALDAVMVAFLRNDGAPHLAMWAKLAGSLANIVLDYVFIFPFGMGMFGAALATGISPIVSLLLISPHFIRRKNGFRPIRCRFSATVLFRAAQLGISSLITELSSGIVILAFNFVLLSLAGNSGIAAYGILANIFLVGTALFTGIGQGIQPIASVQCGAGRIREVRRVLMYGSLLALLIAAGLYAFCTAFSEPILALFQRDPDPVLTRLAGGGIPLYFLAFLPMGVNLVCVALFAAVSKPVQAFSLSVLRGFLLVLPVLFLFSFLWGVTGVWLSVPVAEAGTLVLAALFAASYFHSHKSFSK